MSPAEKKEYNRMVEREIKICSWQMLLHSRKVMLDALAIHGELTEQQSKELGLIEAEIIRRKQK